MLFPASGTGRFAHKTSKIIRFARYGCANRPFFHIVVTEVRRGQHKPVIEQVGTYDPYPNEYNEKLVALNLERIGYWIGKGADVSKPVSQLFGLSGLFPVHPSSYMTAWRNRQAIEEADKKAATEVEKKAATEATEKTAVAEKS